MRGMLSLESLEPQKNHLDTVYQLHMWRIPLVNTNWSFEIKLSYVEKPLYQTQHTHKNSITTVAELYNIASLKYN